MVLSKPFTVLSDVWWFKIPKILTRFSKNIASIYADGIYFQAWPAFGALLVPAIFIMGLIIGSVHFAPGETFTFSIIVMATLLILSNFSAGLGMWLFLGYIIGDFFLFSGHISLEPYGPTIEEVIVKRIALILLYVLLSQLLIFFPMVSSWLRKQALERLNLEGKVRIIVNTIVQGTIQGALVYVWTLEIPTLIRPYYTWSVEGYLYQPPTEAIQPLQESGYLLVLLATVIGAARMLLLYRAYEKPGMIHKLENLMKLFKTSSKVTQTSFRIIVSIILQAGFITFLLSGLLSNLGEATIVFVLLNMILVTRMIVANKLRKYVNLISRIPLIIRLAACAILSYYIGSSVLELQWNSLNTFQPILMGILVSWSISIILVPTGGNTESANKLGVEKKA